MLADLLRKVPATVAAETLAAALTLGRDHSWRDNEAGSLAGDAPAAMDDLAKVHVMRRENSWIRLFPGPSAQVAHIRITMGDKRLRSYTQNLRRRPSQLYVIIHF
jgi:hypothetical protein